MEPLHTIEYEMTSELASEIHRTLSRWEFRRGWRRDLPMLVGGLVLAAAVVVLGLQGWMLPLVAGGLVCLIAFFMMGTVFRRLSIVRGGAHIPLLALYTSDHRVRVEFWEERVRMETEYFRGEGAWTELNDIAIFPRFWSICLANGGQVVLPSALVTPELGTFLRGKAQEMMAAIHQG